MGLQLDLTACADGGIWTEAEPLVCPSVVSKAPNTVTFSFVSPSGAQFRSEPGQFLTLELTVPGETVWNTYTISSSPSRPLPISVSVKAQAGSIGLRWMLDHLEPGMQTKRHWPRGHLHAAVQATEERPLYFSGFGHHSVACDDDLPLRSRHQHRRDLRALCPASAGYHRAPAAGADSVTGTDAAAVFIVEEDDPHRLWTGLTGRLNQLMIGPIAGDYLEHELYCCGPEPFMNAEREMLIGLGHDIDRHHQESFAAPGKQEEQLPEREDIVPDPEASASLFFARFDVTAACWQTDAVLAIARIAGNVIPSGCTFGVCGTCKVRKTSGDVQMSTTVGSLRTISTAASFSPAAPSRPKRWKSTCEIRA